jgi:hypothetical protein
LPSAQQPSFCVHDMRHGSSRQHRDLNVAHSRINISRSAVRTPTLESIRYRQYSAQSAHDKDTGNVRQVDSAHERASSNICSRCEKFYCLSTSNPDPTIKVARMSTTSEVIHDYPILVFAIARLSFDAIVTVIGLLACVYAVNEWERTGHFHTRNIDPGFMLDEANKV